MQYYNLIPHALAMKSWFKEKGLTTVVQLTPLQEAAACIGDLWK